MDKIHLSYLSPQTEYSPSGGEIPSEGRAKHFNYFTGPTAKTQAFCCKSSTKEKTISKLAMALKFT
ncbi:hypothetical protein JCM31185_04690 [Furfurilactobacillus curtus]|uniref:Uncharacterized protein n=1 Tax=Furfurilactobacillus curtus TaxID=1746200 RepID=A0ABQ5JLZ2_9LACO